MNNHSFLITSITHFEYLLIYTFNLHNSIGYNIKFKKKNELKCDLY